MKRRRSLPLFQPLEPDVFLIDTSSWLNIDRHPNSEEIWTAITVLIEQGRIVACAQVLAELRDNPMYLFRLKPYEKALQAGDRGSEDVAYLQHVGRVTYEHPAMSKATGFRTPADPYIVALAELEKYVVVADETRTRRPNRKIPGVCQKRGIRCLTLREFVTAIKSGR
jgi:Domain of unknown function (DUF4411)